MQAKNTQNDQKIAEHSIFCPRNLSSMATKPLLLDFHKNIFLLETNGASGPCYQLFLKYNWHTEYYKEQINGDLKANGSWLYFYLK